MKRHIEFFINLHFEVLATTNFIYIMKIQTYTIGLAGRTYRTEKCILINDPRSNDCDELEAIRKELMPEMYQEYPNGSKVSSNIGIKQVNRDKIVILPCQDSKTLSDDDDNKSKNKRPQDETSLDTHQKSLQLLKNNCCIFL